MLEFLKIRKLPNLFHGNYLGINFGEIVVVVNFDPSTKCCKTKKGSSRSTLWAFELSIYISNACGKISAAPLNSLSSALSLAQKLFSYIMFTRLSTKGE